VRLVPHSLVLVKEQHANLLRELLPGSVECITSVTDARKLASTATLLFIDLELIDQLDVSSLRTQVVGLTESDQLGEIVSSLTQRNGLSHVLSTRMLETPRARAHLEDLVERAYSGNPFALGRIKGEGIARVALLARASKRQQRFDRMNDFFSKNGVSSRSVSALLEIAEELVMNALYDAPLEAGFFTQAQQRVDDVELPLELACEISYGIEDGVAFVRVRDPFGGLSRSRLVQVLSRCNNGDVQLDVSRGGAGLGLWRVFSQASTVSITVIPKSLTEVRVGIAIKRKAGGKLEATHLYFVPASEHYESLAVIPDDDHGLVDQSITLILSA
jgi:hypothetical protein